MTYLNAIGHLLLDGNGSTPLTHIEAYNVQLQKFINDFILLHKKLFLVDNCTKRYISLNFSLT
jgi:hypothetical protein